MRRGSVAARRSSSASPASDARAEEGTSHSRASDAKGSSRASPQQAKAGSPGDRIAAVYGAQPAAPADLSTDDEGVVSNDDPADQGVGDSEGAMSSDDAQASAGCGPGGDSSNEATVPSEQVSQTDLISGVEGAPNARSEAEATRSLGPTLAELAAMDHGADIRPAGDSN